MKILAFIFTLLLSFQALAEEALNFAIVPQQSASRITKLWLPILNYLGQHSDLRLRIRTAPDIPTFEQRLAEGQYDLAYMNPWHYTQSHQSPGYQAFAKARDIQIKGILVVPKDSPIQQLHELAGQTLAFPSPAAFAASILPRANLAAQDIPINPKYVSSHDSVYLTVAKGLYPAGGGIIRTLRNVSTKTRDKLRILWTSQGYTPHAFASHPRVDSQNVARLLKAMLGMQQDPLGKALLDAIKIQGFEATSDSDWDDIRALDIQAPFGLDS